jgi:NOL1/NOP2/sun family putative RNA methylase
MHKLPEIFVERIKFQFGQSATDFLEALGNTPAVSVRLNPAKPFDSTWIGNQNVPWCSDGFYLDEKPVFTLDPLFHAGCYYPQEASSMVLDWVLRNVCELPQQPVILDLCAAPGGKSTLLASFLRGNGMLVANEIIKNRAVILSENLIKWGAANCIVTRNDPSDFATLTSLFDLMVVDAPCSGEGMFRKDTRAIEEWSESNARMCAARQRRILNDVWPSLKEGGYLIYSTCTFNPDENEDNIDWFIKETGAEVLKLEVPGDWGVVTVPVSSGNGLAFHPHRAKGEGFFVAVLRKTASEATLRLSKEKKRREGKVPAVLDNLLSKTREWVFHEETEGWRAFPAFFSSELLFLRKQLNVLRYGVLTGQDVAKNWSPAHETALCTELNPTYFSCLNLDKYESLRYLKGEALSVKADQKGILIVKHLGIPLGFVKNIGSRMNNLYPSGWRIRMNIPDDLKSSSDL